jgi:endonuclease/exonuclease/phosphatase (EEP) superfamily protein YafD
VRIVSQSRAALFVARPYWPLWLAVIPLLAWALVRAFGLEGDSPIVPLLAFTPYAAIAAFLLAGVCVALRNWAAAIVTAVALTVLAAAVVPRAFGGGEGVPANATRIDVLSANLHLGQADPSALVDLVEERRPDLVFAQETSRAETDRLRRAGIERLLPHAVLAVPARGFGRGVYSRLPLRRLRGSGASAIAMPPVAVDLPGGGSIRAIDVHPHPPYPGKEAAWAGVLERLPNAGSGSPWLLVGDFNSTVDDAELRDVLARGYRDAAEVTGSSLDMTWPSNAIVPPLIAIDHVLADRRIGIADYGTAYLPGTDHRAIYAGLFLR